MTEDDLPRQLAELLEPEPTWVPGLLFRPPEEKIVPVHWWTWHGRWRPITFDHNTLASVRKELLRQGLHFAFVSRVAELVDDKTVWHVPEGAVTHAQWLLINASPKIQIQAAIEILKEVARAPMTEEYRSSKAR